MPIFNVKKFGLNDDQIESIISKLESDDAKESLLSSLKVAFEGGVILSRTFYEWKANFSYRRTMTSHTNIDVSHDPDCVFIGTSILQAISNTNAQYIVAKFGCDDAPDYKNLSLYFCGMNKPDIITDTNEIYKASLAKGTPAIRVTVNQMNTAIRNFRNRNRFLSSAGLPYFAEIEGIAHKSANIIQFATDNKITEFAVHFGVELRGGTTIMLLNSDADILRATSVIDDDDVYDHGTGCCPLP